jgi:hypothetical protein
MEPAQQELAQRIRARAFRSRNPRSARKLLALAGEVETMRFASPPVRLLALLRMEDAETLCPQSAIIPAMPANDNPPPA